MNKIQSFSASPRLHLGVVVGRALLGALFVVSGLLKIGHFASVSAMLTTLGLPFVQCVTVLVIIVEVGVGLALALGWKTRFAAAVLALFVVPATFIFHSFWFADSANYSNQLNHFLKNCALFGALLMLACTNAIPRLGRAAD
ncbi:DoxX family protein [Cupriavidus basilensis]|uniref:DoxX family protein n=1 Tax=Cupriavidus basilensis TaxID=68895 RepID=A0A643FWE4_9BURK|nr:DoxX family protein [Cupriavidus basilensis]QOT79403.1 DoxX family protein [Cupriavidus basilensis]